MIFREYTLPAVAVLGLAAAAYTVSISSRRLPAAPPVAPPAPSPYELQIAGAGLVEARSENVAIGTPLPGIVAEVAVSEGQRIERGELLFRLDDRQQRAELAQRAADVASAEAELARLRALPRPEDLPPAQARVDAARAALEDSRANLARAESVSDKRAVSQEEANRRRFAVAAAEAVLSEAEAEQAKLRAGAWQPELDLAQARVAAARAALRSVETELERLSVRAPIDGTCLQLNVRAGEHAGLEAREPLLLLGDISRLHVRVDIDESDAWRFRPGSPARGFVRGNSELATPLEFVRVDPYVLPKRSLTGDTLERIDTRVLQVLYSFPADALPVYVGQQMDVFIEAANGRGKQ